MPILDQLLIECADRGGEGLLLSPNRRPRALVGSKFDALATRRLIPDVVAVLISEALISHRCVDPAARRRLDRFEYQVSLPDGHIVRFVATIRYRRKELFAIFVLTDPAAPAAIPFILSPFGRLLAQARRDCRTGPDVDSSPNNDSGRPPAFVPLGPRRPLRPGRDAKLPPWGGKGDDNLLAW